MREADRATDRAGKGPGTDAVARGKTTMDMFDVSHYVTPTRFGGLSGIFLARALLQAAPAEPSDRLRGALVNVRDAAEQLRAVARERMRTSPRNLRPLDGRLDSGWVGLRETVEAKSRLVGSDVGDRAAALAATLFPNGTAFVRAGYREQWAASQLHLERVEEEGLTGEIEALAGAEYLPYIRNAHTAFGEALGLGEDIPANPDTSALSSASTSLGQAIAEYGRIMAGELDRDDEASVTSFRRAMAPVDDQRRSFGKARGSREEDVEESEPEVDLEEPMPPVEPAAPSA